MNDNLVGSNVFNTWKVAERIGAGSFGTVYKIEHNDDYGVNYTAALKVIRIPKDESELRSLLAEGYDIESFEEIVKDITSEISLMARLKGNSNIISFEDHMVTKHTDSIGWDIFIRMEYLTPLYDYLIGLEKITAKTILKIGIDICSALELCQKHNIVHRDIKPENIFVSDNNDFKLGDFGIARIIEKANGSFSKKGSYNYMAPEVYKGEKYGATIDIYSLGIVLYRFFNNNKVPFLNAETNKYTVDERESALNKRMKGEPLSAPKNATEDIARVILKACAYRPEDRYASPSEFKRDLIALCDSLTYDDYEMPCFSKGAWNGTGSFSEKKEQEYEEKSYAPTNLMWEIKEDKKSKVPENYVPEVVEAVMNEAYKSDVDSNTKNKNKKVGLIICVLILLASVVIGFVVGNIIKNNKEEPITTEITTETTEVTTTKPTTESTTESTTETTTEPTTTAPTKASTKAPTPPTTKYVPNTKRPTSSQSNWGEYNPNSSDSNFDAGSWKEY